MMIRAYDEIYLDDAMRNLGDMMDYVANYLKMDMDDFFIKFINTGIGGLFATGHPKYIAGMSGIELSLCVLEQDGYEVDCDTRIVDFEPSSQYWCGWIMAYYQWYTAMPFERIIQYITFEEIESMYYPLHEASEMKFVDILNKRIIEREQENNLQRLRRLAGYSQRILAMKSGVNLRTLQQYEIGAKNINNASFKTVMALARTLGCNIEDLFEYSVYIKEDELLEE